MGSKERPRNHVLEQESRRLFVAGLPGRVQERPENPDYGYDFQMEDFPPDGTSGPRWFVQLKGTDSTDSDALRSRYRVVRLTKYLFEAPLPVMLVHYSAARRELRFLWIESAHRQLLERASDWFRWEHASLDFSSAEVLDKGAWDQIVERDLQERTKFRRDSPVNFSVAAGEENAKVSAWLEGALMRGPQNLAIRVSDEAHASAHVVVDGRSIQVYWTSDGGHELMLSAARPEGRWPRVPADVATEPWRRLASRVGLAFWSCAALTRPGRGVLREFIGPLCSDDGDVYLKLINPVRLSMAFVADGTAHELVAFVAARGIRCHGALFQWLFFTRRCSWARDVHLRWDWALAAERLADASRSDPSVHAAVAYSTANVWIELSQYREAFRMLRTSRSVWPDYSNRAYYWRDLGGVLYELGRRRSAAKCYTMAILLEGFDSRVGFRLADCLFQTGENEAAAYWIEQSGADDLAQEPWWSLLAFAVDTVAEIRGASRPDSLDVGGLEERGMGDPRASGLRLAWLPPERHGLDWFNLGVSWAQAGDREQSFRCWVICALIQPWDAEAWTNAIGLSLMLPAHHIMVPVLVNCARRTCGGELLGDALAKFLERQQSAEAADLFEEAVALFLAAED